MHARVLNMPVVHIHKKVALNMLTMVPVKQCKPCRLPISLLAVLIPS